MLSMIFEVVDFVKCIGLRERVVNTVRDRSAFDFDIQEFESRGYIDDNIYISFLSDRSLVRIHTQSRHHPGTIGSHAWIEFHPHIYNSDNRGTNMDIIRVYTSTHGG